MIAVDPDRRVDQAKRERGWIEAGDDAVLARRHHGPGDATGRHDGVGGDVAGATEVFEQRRRTSGSTSSVGRGEQGSSFRLACARVSGAIAAASAKASSSVSRDRLGAAGRSGKSSATMRADGCPRGAARRRRSSAPTAAGSAAGPRRRARARPAARPPRAESAPSRMTPAARDRIGRTAAGSGAGGAAKLRSGGRRARRRAARLTAATAAPKTAASISELLASRLAPCRPVEAASPQAQSPSTELRPSASTATPPIW